MNIRSGVYTISYNTANEKNTTTNHMVEFTNKRGRLTTISVSTDALREMYSIKATNTPDSKFNAALVNTNIYIQLD
jgi:hypothetical protein